MRDTRYEIGSALILAVVLTSLLAIIGVMFLMVARVDRMATSGISENKELNFAVETVIAKISQELVLDVLDMSDPNRDYYDYPDPCNAWLASLEPYEFGGNYYWRHISDIYDRFGPQGLGAATGIINDYQSSTDVGDSNGYIPVPVFYPADADGDGVSDSMWVELEDITSSKGKPIFAAIRVIDNGGMLNVNTIFADPNAGDKRKGDMLTDIYIDGLVKLGGDQIFKFIENRSGDPAITEVAAQQYHIEVSRRVENPAASNPPYTLYDISEELSLRNRFVLFPNGTITRLEAGKVGDPDRCLSTTLRWKGYGNSYAPYTTSDFESWKRRLNPLYDANEPVKSNYDFRHLLTNYSMDRIINPNGGKMVNVNRINPIAEPNITDLYNAIWVGLYDAGVLDPNSLAAQMAVNIVDYRDADSDVTVYNGYYGFERPCVYISELVYKEDVNDPNYRSYAVELYKPYYDDSDPDPNWQLVIDGNTIDITWSGTRQFHVVLFEEPNAPLTVSPTASVQTIPLPAGAVAFDVGDLIELQRFVIDVNVVVDSIQVPAWLPVGAGIRSHQRDITRHKCIRRLWADASEPNSLGDINIYKPVEDLIYIQAHPYLDPSIYENKGFKNIGETGMVFRKPAYYRVGEDPILLGVIGYSSNADTEVKVRINLVNPIFQQIFNYLTVFDPSSDGINNDGDYKSAIENIDENNLDETPEWKIPGRININTAPWYIIAQLPWVSYHTPNFDLARAIVDYRDNTAGGFGSIGELNRVGIGDPNNYRSMGFYALDPNDLQDFPDLTPRDGAISDFEERDVIFARISNLVTVRSDVFTAYILVRIGVDGPQKRVIAILDRSNVYSGSSKVRIVALHPVPDPR